jgi:hypothetical protein
MLMLGMTVLELLIASVEGVGDHSAQQSQGENVRMWAGRLPPSWASQTHDHGGLEGMAEAAAPTPGA